MNKNIFATWLTFVTLVFLPLQLSSEIIHAKWSLSAVLLLALLVYSIFRLTWIAYRGLAHPMSITFWLFVYVWGSLAPLMQTLTGIWPRWRVHNEDYEFIACIVLWLGVFAYEIGRQLPRMLTLPSSRKAPHNSRHYSFSVRSVLIVSVLSIVIAIILIIAVGGPGVLLGSRGDINNALYIPGEKSSSLLIQSLLRGPPFVSMMSLIYLLKTRRYVLTQSERRWLLGILVIVLPLNLIVNYPPALQRFWFGTIVLTYCFTLLRWKPISASIYISVFSLTLIFAFPVLNEFRQAGSDENFNLDQFSNKLTFALKNPLDHIRRGDYDAYQMLVDSTIYVEREGSMMGKNVFDSFLFWFPRSWWPSKHIGSGHLIGQYFRYPFTNLAAPLWEEAYIAFNWLGVVIILATYGSLTAAADRLFENGIGNSEGRSLWVWIVALLAGYQVFLLRGDLLCSLAYLSCPLLFLVLMLRKPTLAPRRNVGFSTVRPVI